MQHKGSNVTQGQISVKCQLKPKQLLVPSILTQIPKSRVRKEISLFSHSPGVQEQQLIVIMSQCIVFHTFWWVGWEVFLANGHEPFQALDVFPLSFVVQDMSHVFWENFLSTSSGMDANHSNTNRPRSIANSHLEVSIVGLDIFSLQHKLDNISYRFLDVCRKSLNTKERTFKSNGQGVREAIWRMA